MKKITLKYASSLATLAMEKAEKEYKKPVCVAICDENGYMIKFERMDGAPLRSINISEQKAYTAALMEVSTSAFLDRLNREKIEVGYFCNPLFTALPGGSPLKDDGKIIGGIGVSGLAASEDQVITDYVAGLFLSMKDI